MNKRFDAYIFDMDGTLWDAVDSYAAIWNTTIVQLGVQVPPVTRQKLVELMGMPLDAIYDSLVGDCADRRKFEELLLANDSDMMPELGGRLYPGVRETLDELRDSGALLMMVSNCTATGLPNFVAYNRLEGYFSELLSMGATGKDKTANIKALISRYNLSNPVYVGDTAGDCTATHAAGIPLCGQHMVSAKTSRRRLHNLFNKRTSEHMKEPYDFHNPNLLGVAEQIKRLRPLRQAMEQADLRAALVSSPVSIYYLTGRIYRGYLYITVDNDAPLYLVRRPTILHGPGVHLIAKPSQINETLAKAGMAVGEPVALELDTMPYHDAMRLAQALGMEAPEGNISPLLRACRAVKTEREKDMLRRSGVKHAEVYSRIPGLYKTGMTDIELQIEIERASRLEGCLGIFRCAGPEMEIFMGNVLTGDNADAPSPYDFAMGGAGLDPSLPVGADGTVIRPGLPVMVDVNGNYTGYMTDMTRCFAAGTVSPEVEKANRLSADICAGLAA